MHERGDSRSLPGRLRETPDPSRGDGVRPGPRSPEDALAGELARLRRSYRLRPLPGTLTVLTTMDYTFRRDVWLRLAEEVRWQEVPVPHATSFLQPHADVLGRAIAEHRGRGARAGSMTVGEVVKASTEFLARKGVPTLVSTPSTSSPTRSASPASTCTSSTTGR